MKQTIQQGMIEKSKLSFGAPEIIPSAMRTANYASIGNVFKIYWKKTLCGKVVCGCTHIYKILMLLLREFSSLLIVNYMHFGNKACYFKYRRNHYFLRHWGHNFTLNLSIHKCMT